VLVQSLPEDIHTHQFTKIHEITWSMRPRSARSSAESYCPYAWPLVLRCWQAHQQTGKLPRSAFKRGRLKPPFCRAVFLRVAMRIGCRNAGFFHYFL
jgi:hypothetical protein